MLQISTSTKTTKTTATPPNLVSKGNLQTYSLGFSTRTWETCADVRLCCNHMWAKEAAEKSFEVWVCLLLAGVINSGGALVRDLSTQIWITRQRNLARSNLCVWYLHESKRECETSAANNRNSHVFLLFACFAASSLCICQTTFSWTARPTSTT